MNVIRNHRIARRWAPAVAILAAVGVSAPVIGHAYPAQYPQQQPPPPQSYPQQPPPPQSYPSPQQYPAQNSHYPPQQQQPYYRGQAPYSGPAPAFYPEQVDGLVSRIALYPDPLLAQLLTAATYPDQIQEAAGWANAHRYVSGDQLARAIEDDRLPWQPSVIALLPFPQVLDMMASDMGWTQQLGSAVLAQRPEVMDAVQRMRRRAYDYGYLRDTPQQRVIFAGGTIEVLPANNGYYYVPAYNPGVIFVRPSRGIMSGVIQFGPRVYVGASFSPWGWGSPGFDWRAHTVVIDRRPWDRTWVNRDRYVAPYPARRYDGPIQERHERERGYQDNRDRRSREGDRERERR